MLGVIVVLAAGGLAVLFAFPDAPPPGPAGHVTQPPISDPAPITLAEGITYRDFVYATSVVPDPTDTKTQSKLWFAHDHWWAGMVQPTTNRVNIFRLDPVTQLWMDTGTMVDERPFADPDFLWDGRHLRVVSSGPGSSPSHETRILRFSYDEEAGRFDLDPNFPVTLVPSGVTAAVIAVDSSDTSWVTYVLDGRVWVAHSVGDDARWGEPYPLAFAEAAIDPKDIASIVAFGPGRIGVMWSNQLRDSVYFSVHEDGTGDDGWSRPEIVVDGLGSSDDHLNLKSFPLQSGTGVVAALKTSLDDGDNVNRLAPLIQLAVRHEDGGWTAHMVGQVRDHHTRAVVMVDETARMFYVAATSPTPGGVIYYKQSPIDRISFDTGLGVPLVSSLSDQRINGATSTKQSLTAESGLVVLASDHDSGRYLHGLLDLGGGLPTADPTDPDRLDRPDPPDPPNPVTFLDDDFEPWPVGPADGVGWAVRDADPPDAISIVKDGADGRALRITPAASGAAVRACRQIAQVADVSLQADVRVRVDTLGNGDTTLLSMRGSAGDTASIRVTDRGVFAWFDGSTKVRSALAFRPGTWYRVSATIDEAGRTYDLVIADDAGRPLIERNGLGWRSADVASVRAVCLETADAARGQAIDIGEVHVREASGS